MYTFTTIPKIRNIHSGSTIRHLFIVYIYINSGVSCTLRNKRFTKTFTHIYCSLGFTASGPKREESVATVIHYLRLSAYRRMERRVCQDIKVTVA